MPHFLQYSDLADDLWGCRRLPFPARCLLWFASFVPVAFATLEHKNSTINTDTRSGCLNFLQQANFPLESLGHFKGAGILVFYFFSFQKWTKSEKVESAVSTFLPKRGKSTFYFLAKK